VMDDPRDVEGCEEWRTTEWEGRARSRGQWERKGKIIISALHLSNGGATSGFTLTRNQRMKNNAELAVV
jgi:hypothetical protein